MLPPKTHFLTFSKVQKHTREKEISEIKIMKITHSAVLLKNEQNREVAVKIDDYCLRDLLSNDLKIAEFELCRNIYDK